MLRLLILAQALVASAQTWCGKNYMKNQSVVPPGGEFVIPGKSNQPLLLFRCAPAVQPYLASDQIGGIIVDTRLTNDQIANTSPIKLPSGSTVPGIEVLVTVNGRPLTAGFVPVPANAHQLDLPLDLLPAQNSAYDVQCSAQTVDGQRFSTSTTLLRLPDRSDGGSVTKQDYRTGAMLVQNEEGQWETLFPLGFYTDFGGFLAQNPQEVDNIANRGLTIIHPVPSFDNMTAFEVVLSEMEKRGLYLMYDMRGTYMNSSSVTAQVNMMKTYKNLLTWYTADEPDGNGDPRSATSTAYELIKSLDNSYHPVSLVLNCENYYFSEYSSGTDIVMQDAYPIGINATFSVEWGTPCTTEFGDCGCDNCIGSFIDIANRMDEFAYRLDALGRTRKQTVWAVPQAFGASEYWSRIPTGNEWLVESILSINHGATGIVPWIDPNTADILSAATSLGHALPDIKAFIFDPSNSFTFVRGRGPVDVGMWTVGGRTLLMATNMAYSSSSVKVTLPQYAASASQILSSGGLVTVNGRIATISLNSVGSVAYIVQ